MSATPFCIAAAKELAKSRAPASVWKDLEQDANDEGRRAGCEVHLKKNRDGIEWHAKVALVDEDAEGIESRYAICVLQKVDCRGDERPKLLLSKHMPKCEAKRVEIEDAKEKIKELEEKLENTEAKREKEKSEYDAKAERDKEIRLHQNLVAYMEDQIRSCEDSLKRPTRPPLPVALFLFLQQYSALLKHYIEKGNGAELGEADDL